MSIISRTRPPVKPTRIKPRPAAPFGFGILRSLPSDHLQVPLSDLEWAAMAFNLDTDSFDVADEFAAAEASAFDALESGLIPNDVAEHISATSLVGHDDRNEVDAVEVYREAVSRIGGRPISTATARLEMGMLWIREANRR
jgi:hypothetical protein